MISYFHVYFKYEDFLFRGSILVSKLLCQVYSTRKLHVTSVGIVHKFTLLCHIIC